MKYYDEKEKHTLAVYIFIFFLMVMGIVVSGYISFRNFEREFRRQAESQVSAIAELKVNELVNWRKERLADAQFLYHNPAFSSLVERYFENPDDGRARELLLAQLDQYQDSTQYERVRLLDVTGADRLSTTTSGLLDSYLAQNAIASLHSGEVSFFDFHRDTSVSGGIHLSILVPIFAANDRPLGVLDLNINPQTYLYPYIQNWPIPSDTAETLLVRRDGEDVLFLNELRFEKNAALNLRYSLTNTDIPSVKAVLGQTGTVEGVDYRGEPVLADVRAVPDSPWFLVSKMDTAEVFAPLRARLWQILLISGMSIFVASMGLALVWRQQRILFYRTKAETAEALRASEEKMRSIFRVAPTGIGVVRDRVLVEVNKLISEMTGYTEEELIGQNSRILYPTREEFEWVGSEKYKQIAEKGSGVVETRWQKKDGSNIDVLLASTPIDLADLSKGVTFTALDITERKQTEESLKENEAIFSSFLEHSPVYVFFKDKDIRSLRLSKNYEQMLGMPINDLLGKTMDDLFPSDLAKSMIADDQQILNEGKRITVEEELNGRVYETTKFPVFKDGKPYILAGFTLDITERKQAEEALHQRNKHLLALQETALELVSQLDLDILLENIVRRAGQIMGTDSGYLDLVEPSTGQLLPRIGLGILTESLQHSVQPGEGLAGIVWQTAKPLIVNDYDQWTDRVGSFTSGKIRAAIGVPLLSSGKMLGVLGLAYGPDTTKTFGDEDVSVLEQFAQLAAIAIINASLFATAQQELIERKRAEEALRESEERLRLAVSAGRMGTWDRSFLSGKLNWSIECKAMFGLAPEIEMTDERFINALHPEDREPTNLAIAEALQKQTDFDMEYRAIWPDGTIHWIASQGHGYYNEAGQATHMAGITFDITERKQAEESLRQYTSMLEEAEKNASLGSWAFDPAIGEGWWSKQMYRMFGYDISSNVPSFEEHLNHIHPEDRQLVQDALLKMAQGEEPAIHEYRSNPEYGPMRYFLPTQVMKRDADGKPLQIIGTLLDITERKQAEKALRENEEMFRVAFDNAPTGMSIIGAVDFKYLAVNPLLCEMFGYTKEEFLGNTIKLVTHPDDVERSNEWIRKKYNNEPCEPDFEKRYIHKDGHIVWGLVRAQWIRNEDGSPRMAINHILDITKRKQAEEALRESEALYRQAIEVANAVPYRQSYHINGNTVDYDFIGEGIRRITGYGPEEFTETLWDSLAQERFLLDELAEYSFDEAIEQVRSGISPVWKCNHCIRARDRSIHWVFEAAVELRDENGISHGSIGMFQDITERKQTEDEIRRLNAELEQRVRERTVQLETTNQELEAFSYSVSHDLRAPLRGIDGWSLALLEDYHDQLDEQGQQYIDRVRSETQRMGHLIDDMLKLSRLTRAEMIKEQVDLSALAQAIAERLKQDQPHRQVDFIIQAGLKAEGDSRLLEAVLTNLLENAFKFSGKRADARIEFGKVESQGQRAFFVRDNGAGFDMAYSRNLFGAFQRMHKLSEFPGTGIGLATVQRIIHRHGGRVWAEAEPGRGATFYFTLE